MTPSRETILADVKRLKVRYVTNSIAPDTLPQGRILVHNHVIYTGGGFRVWTQDENDPTIMVCNCPYAPKLTQHYRMKPT